jgi:two-component system LytT family response regulator
MARRLKTVIVDDDDFIVKMLTDMCRRSPWVEIVATFLDPRQFLKKAPVMDFDLCLLDVNMPDIQGLVLAQMLGNKPVIFITGMEDKLKDALNLAPIDVIVKPVTKERLNKALEKANYLLASKKEFEYFNVAESAKKVKLHLPDILVITSDEIDPRNKDAIFRNGLKYTLMDYTMEELLNLWPSLVQVNKGQLISIDAFSEIDDDLVVLKGVNMSELPGEVILGRSYRQPFLDRLFYAK